ncbi:hypothetical protein [Streptomyces pseudoechinosporeus]
MLEYAAMPGVRIYFELGIRWTPANSKELLVGAILSASPFATRTGCWTLVKSEGS